MRWLALLPGLLAALIAGALLMAQAKRSGWLDRWFPTDIVGTAHSQIISLQAEARLEVARARLHSRISKGVPDSPLGKARTHVFFTGTASYGIDLRQIGPEDLRFDAASKTLRVALPPVTLGLVEPDTQSLELINEETGVRGLFSDTEARQTLAVKDMTPVLRRDAWSPQLQDFARQSARQAVKALLEASLRASGQAITVEPYFPDAAPGS
jgi:hypothetical protein